MKTCYYELLEVLETATDTELRKAYRRKALQLHPDKNPDDVEGANARFAVVRAAYEVLLDPQERSWYDSHKALILREDDEEFDDEPTTLLPCMLLDELMRYFNPVLYTQVDDSLMGFYKVVERVFDRLAKEEVQHGKHERLSGFDRYKDDDNMGLGVSREHLLFTKFGDSHSDYSDEVRQFYAEWGLFSTVKSFNWRDEYRYSMAPDRRTRRLMERENKKVRDACRKEYNEAVRSYVQFIKKRDPRVKLGAEAVERERRAKQQREFEELAAQKRQQQLALSGKYKEQQWQTMTAEELAELELMLDNEYEALLTDLEFEEEPEDDITNEYECIICDKFFKNENQFISHENSNKHKKALKKLKWEMQKEGMELGLDELESEGESENEPDLENEPDELEPELEHELELEPVAETEKPEPTQPNEATPPVDFSTLAVDDEIDEDLQLAINSLQVSDDDDWLTPNKRTEKGNRKKEKKKKKNRK